MNKQRGILSTGRINFHYLVLVVMIFIVTAAMTVHSPYFLTVNNLQVLIDTFIMEAVMALGMTMVIISGGIDLTVAGILPFSSIILALLLMREVPFGIAAVLVLLAAAAIGCLTNLLRRSLNLHPMVVTMAIAAVIKGVDLTITGGSAVSGLPESFTRLGAVRILGMPVSWIVYIILAAVFLYFSKNNRWFLQVFFVGGNEDAAKLSGIKVEALYRNVYVISAVLAAVAGDYIQQRQLQLRHKCRSPRDNHGRNRRDEPHPWRFGLDCGDASGDIVYGDHLQCICYERYFYLLSGCGDRGIFDCRGSFERRDQGSEGT